MVGEESWEWWTSFHLVITLPLAVAEFIDLYTDHLLNKSVSQHFAAFHRGFHSVCSSNALKVNTAS